MNMVICKLTIVGLLPCDRGQHRNHTKRDMFNLKDLGELLRIVSRLIQIENKSENGHSMLKEETQSFS